MAGRDKFNKEASTEELVDDLLKQKQIASAPAAGKSAANDKDSFARTLEETLRETEEEVLRVAEVASDSSEAVSWRLSRHMVTAFQPVPWFIWRLCNYVLGKPGNIGDVSEGLVFGLKKLIIAAAGDELLGNGSKPLSVRKALDVLEPDVVAAMAVIHAVCRRLASKPYERIWRPILDDAVLRARIGFHVGKECAEFGSGRGMLAGFAGRCGLVILISTGAEDQAKRALEMLATGSFIKNVGMSVYKCDPLQVSAMVLTAAGCGRDAAFGTVSYSVEQPLKALSGKEQHQWLSAFSVCEAVRQSSTDSIAAKHWEILGLSTDKRAALLEVSKKTLRRGHGWHWLM